MVPFETKMKTFVRFSVIGALACVYVSCDDGYTSPKVLPECDPEQGSSSCEEGQVCLGYRCYDQCTSDTHCSRWESCSSGICTSSDTPQDDGGPWPDGDADVDVDVDADVDSDADSDGDVEVGPGCTSCPDHCHPVDQSCVACVVPGQCTERPLCDIAQGTCMSGASGQCAPCDDRFQECGTNVECVDRTEDTSHHEMVCMTACTAGCPGGTHCVGEHCEPLTGVSCTAWYSAQGGRSCVGESRPCQPLGAQEDDVSCSSAGACAIACTESTQCPPGRTCTINMICE